MFKNLFRTVDAIEIKPMKELTDELEQSLQNFNLEGGKWRFGARSEGINFRVIMNADALEFDIALPGVHLDKKEALDRATKLTMSFLSKKNSLS